MIFSSAYTFPYSNLDLCWQFVADGKLYVVGHYTIVADNVPEYLVLSTTDGTNWTQVMQTHTAGFVPPSCKLHLPNGQTGYFGWYCYKDNNADVLAENQFYYYFIPTLTVPTISPLKLLAPSLSNGGDYWFLGALTGKPIVRGNYLYYSVWCDDNSATRHALLTTPYPTVANNKIRIYRISVDDFCAGGTWTKIADITLDHLYANKIYASETDWVLNEKGGGIFEVILMIRAQHWDNNNKATNGTLISKSSDFINWSTAAFAWNGYPSRAYKDYDGTIHVADAERVGAYHWDNPAVITEGKIFRVYSTDGGATFQRESIVSPLQNAGGGYATFHRFKDKLSLVYSDSGTSVGYGTLRRTAQLDALSVTVSGATSINATSQLSATANSVDVTSSGLWISNAPNVATVYNGLVTPVSTGTAKITFDYAGYLVETTVSTGAASPTITFSQQPIVSNSVIYYGTQDISISGILVQNQSKQVELFSAIQRLSGIVTNNQAKQTENLVVREIYSGIIVGNQNLQTSNVTSIESFYGSISEYQAKQSNDIIGSSGVTTLGFSQQPFYNNGIIYYSTEDLTINVYNAVVAQNSLTQNQASVGSLGISGYVDQKQFNNESIQVSQIFAGSASTVAFANTQYSLGELSFKGSVSQVSKANTQLIISDSDTKSCLQEQLLQQQVINASLIFTGYATAQQAFQNQISKKVPDIDKYKVTMFDPLQLKVTCRETLQLQVKVRDPLKLLII